MSRFPSLWSLHGVLWYVRPTFYLPIPHLIDAWVASTFGLSCIMLLWTWMNKYLYWDSASQLCLIYLQVELLNHMKIIFLILWGTTILVFIVAASFTFPPTVYKGSNLSTSCINTCYFPWLLTVIFLKAACVNFPFNQSHKLVKTLRT